jgi:hypothetical protein
VQGSQGFGDISIQCRGSRCQNVGTVVASSSSYFDTFVRLLLDFGHLEPDLGICRCQNRVQGPRAQRSIVKWFVNTFYKLETLIFH